MSQTSLAFRRDRHIFTTRLAARRISLVSGARRRFVRRRWSDLDQFAPDVPHRKHIGRRVTGPHSSEDQFISGAGAKHRAGRFMHDENGRRPLPLNEAGSSTARSRAAPPTGARPAAFSGGASRLAALAINPADTVRRLNFMLSSPASRRWQEEYKRRML